MLRKSELSNVVVSSIFPVRKPLPRGLNGTKPMPSSSRVGNTFFFRLSPPQGVFALERRDRIDGVCAPDRLHTRFRKSEVPDLTFLNQIFHCSCHVFDRHVRINAMLIEEIDVVGVQSLERGFGHLLDVLGPTIHAHLLSLGTKFEAEFGCDHYLTAKGSERFAYKFFVCEWAVHFGSVEERYAAFYGRPNQ